MNGCWIALTLALIGTDYGWQKTPNGEWEYIIQIEPELLESLKEGEEIVSEIPRELKNVRRFRIRVGDGPLPRGEDAPAQGRAEAMGDTVNPPAAPPDFGSNFDPNVTHPAGTGAAAAAAAANPGNGGAFPVEPPRGGDFGDAGSNRRRNLPGIPPLSGQGGVTNDNTDEPPALYKRQTNEPPGRTPAEDAASGGAFVPPAFDPPAWNSSNAMPPGEKADGAPIPARDDEEALRPIPNPQAGLQPDRLPELNPAEVTPLPGNRAAGYDEPVAEPDAKGTGPRQPQKTLPAKGPIEPPKPWTPLLLTSLALFASIGINIYLGWITLGTYQRYQHLAKEVAATD